MRRTRRSSPIPSRMPCCAQERKRKDGGENQRLPVVMGIQVVLLFAKSTADGKCTGQSVMDHQDATQGKLIPYSLEFSISRSGFSNK